MKIENSKNAIRREERQLNRQIGGEGAPERERARERTIFKTKTYIGSN